MSRRRHTPEQVVRKLREAVLAGAGCPQAEGADRLLGERIELPEVFKALEVSEQTYYWWRNQSHAYRSLTRGSVEYGWSGSGKRPSSSRPHRSRCATRRT